MRSVSLLAAAAVIGLSALTTACGQQTAGSGTGGSSGRPAPSTGAPAAAACGAATPTSPPGRILTLSAGDSGGSFCVKPGTGVLIYLKGTPTLKWAGPKSSSAALVPRANGHLALALGVTGGYFVAAQPGVAAITSSRSPCQLQASASPPAGNQKKCGITQTFRVTVRVAS
jgi:hypothetical protein